MELVPEASMPRTMTMQRWKSGAARRASVSGAVQKSLKGIGGQVIHLGDAVWVREKGAYPFMRATLTQISGATCKVTMENGILVQKRCEELYAANRPQDAPDDHSSLTHLNESCILDSTAKRFAAGKIYTYTGRILIAVNPFRDFGLYGEEKAAEHIGTDDSASLPPHVYSVAERAYSRLRSVNVGQAIVMSGESGAGKTETARHVVNYMLMRADVDGGAGSRGISNAILESSIITEAFGNSKTRRNNNSSRFGKYMILSFAHNGSVASAAMQTYMLERSRVTQLIEGERSYHVFYQLLATEDDGLRSIDWLSALSVARCRVLASSDCPSIEGVSHAAGFGRLDKSLATVGLEQGRRYELYAMLAAILHLENVAFEPKDAEANADPSAQISTSGGGDGGGDGGSSSSSREALEWAGALVGCESALEGLLTTRQLSSGRRQEAITKALSVAEANATRDAIARAAYSSLFTWIEAQLNRNLFGDGSSKVPGAEDDDGFLPGPQVSLLDIFGFERFPTNGFEQLCINYCNEKLQQFWLLTTAAG